MAGKRAAFQEHTAYAKRARQASSNRGIAEFSPNNPQRSLLHTEEAAEGAVPGSKAPKSTKHQVLNEIESLLGLERWPYSGICLLSECQRSFAGRWIQEEGADRFPAMFPILHGASYPDYVTAVNSILLATRLTPKHLDDRILFEWDQWLREQVVPCLIADMEYFVNVDLDPIMQAGFLEEWWNSATSFLFMAYKLIDQLTSPNGSWEYIRLWCRAVMSVRQKYNAASPFSEVDKSHGTLYDFVDAMRYGDAARREPFWFVDDDDDDNISSQFGEEKTATAIERLSQHTRFLLSTIHEVSEPSDDIFKAYEILKDIRAFSLSTKPASQIDHRSLAMQAFKLWTEAKNENIRYFASHIMLEIQNMNHCEGTLESIELSFDRAASHLYCLQSLSGFFLTPSILENFENDIQTHLLEFRGRRYNDKSGIPGMWYLIWRTLEKLSRGETNRQHKAGTHQYMDLEFILFEQETFELIRDNYIYSRRAIHYVVQKYCERILDAVERGFIELSDSLPSNLNQLVSILQRWVDTADGAGILMTDETFHKSLHWLACCVGLLCMESGFTMGTYSFDSIEGVSQQTMKPNLDRIPQHVLQAAFVSLPKELRSATSSSQPQAQKFYLPRNDGDFRAQSTSFTDRSQSPFKNRQFPTRTAVHHSDNAQNEPSFPKTKDIKKPPYMRFVEGSGQYNMGETLAMTRAISERIAKDLVEPGIDQSPASIDVSCNVQYPFQLPGINHPAGLYDRVVPSSESR